MARYLSQKNLNIQSKIRNFNFGLLFLVTLLASIGFLMLYSAAGQSLSPWAIRQMVRFGMGLVVLVFIALVDIRIWLRWAYVFYFLSLAALIAVAIKGHVGMGAQRWINLGFMKLQPSEFMKISLVLALARYFHTVSLTNIRQITPLLPPLAFVLLPVALVLTQPDLGTALLMLMGAGSIFFVAGVRAWKFILLIAGGLGSIPILWNSLHAYQKERILTFLDPERDPLGAGYHILQSKIAIGSGGIWGKGFLKGTQGHLNFLPEKQTDFIFTMFAEEFGLMGSTVLLLLFALAIFYGYIISFRSKSHFGQFLGIGVTTTFFLYFFINMGMVMGLMPVVGVPLPLISYGGSAMLAVMIGFGFLMNIHIHSGIQISRNETFDF